MTLNAHSLLEPDYEDKLRAFAEWAAEERYDVIALQESNQTHGGTPASASSLSGYVRTVDSAVINDDNHIMRLASMLRVRGLDYFWSWVPLKLCYEKYDEGVGILSRIRPSSTEAFYVSKSRDYMNWRVRGILRAEIPVSGSRVTFFSSHFGWWSDEEEDFPGQFGEFLKHTASCRSLMVLMGDFNNPAGVPGEGYDLVCSSGWYDTYEMAEVKDDGVTVSGSIDGWRDGKGPDDRRIDFIMTRPEVPVRCSRVVLNGSNGPIVSDHFGVEAVLF